MTRPTAFSVPNPVVPLAVILTDGVVTRLNLGMASGRPAATPSEQWVARELREYLEGRRSRFTFAVSPSGTEFDRAVWNVLREIPYGETTTYGQVARAVGNPRAARAVGLAAGRNPVPIAIPCHRVVGAGGKLGGFGGGLPLKRRLLDLETRHRAQHTSPGRVATLLTVALVTLMAGCTDPERPAFGPGRNSSDTTPPVIEFLAPAEGATVAAGDRILVSVQVTDQSSIVSISASVQGAVILVFPAIVPEAGDTSFAVDFPIQTNATTLGLATFVVSAEDALTNRSSATLSFSVQ